MLPSHYIQIDTRTLNPADVLFKDAIQLYIAGRNQHSKSWLSSDKYRAAKVERELGHIMLADLTSSVITNWKLQRLQQVKENTARADVAYIQRVMNYCRKDLQIPISDVFANVRMPRGDVQRERIPTEAELTSIFDALPSDVRPIAELAAQTAMRRSELLRLKPIDINLRHRTATLHDTKNGSKRVVPLSTTAVHILAREIPRVSSGRKIFNVSAERVTKQFRKACDHLGLHDIVFHSLRHYAATHFFELGLEMLEVAAITGHKDMRMLQRYTHLSASKLALKLG